MAVLVRGMLEEYGKAEPPLRLVFDFNPQTISRSRTVSLKMGDAPGTRGGYDFRDESETARVAQGVEQEAEGFSIDILLDATDAMSLGDPIARKYGVQPQIDTLRSMVDPKVQGADGKRTLASLGAGGDRAFQAQETPSVIIFHWGMQRLPVFVTGVSQKEVMHLPNLMPYRAEMGITLQVIESNNPFFIADRNRQQSMTELHASTAGKLGGIL